jgi:hypothetical protein
MRYGANVYFNERGSFDGYTPGDPLTLSSVVMFPEADSAKGAAEVVFGYLNADDRPNGRTERSLSVGDVVKIIIPPEHEGATGYFVWFACEPVGWVEIDEPLLD